MTRHGQAAIRLSVFTVLALLCGACGAFAAPPSPPQQTPGGGAPLESATPFLPATPTSPPPATSKPETLTIWISPALPDSLRTGVESLDMVAGQAVQLVESPGAAKVRVEPQADLPLARWFYAPGAAFKTVQDELSLDEFWARWLGAAERGITAAPPEAAMLEAIFLEPMPGGVEAVPREDQLAQAWEDPGRITILPFEALEPRWKVLSFVGESPIRQSFDDDEYLLQMTFGLSGDPALLLEVAAALDWPASNRDPERMTVVLMTGVSALTRATASRMEIMGVTYPGERIRDWTTAVDFMHVSHEVAFAQNCPPPDPVQRGLRFCSAPENLELFEDIGVDVVELTGNHVNDWGEEALDFTLDLYQDADMAYFGGGEDLERALQPLLIEHNGNRLAFIGCNYAGPPNAWATEERPGSAPCDLDRLLTQVTELRAQGYIPIFTFQWHEYYTPRPVEQQRDLFRQAAQAGAVIVNGSQAHQPQAMEFYEDGFIHYGLGNLFFDQLWRLEVRQEFLDRHVFYDGRHISTELLTAMLEDWAQPRPMLPQEREVFLGDIFEASGW